MTEGAKLVNSKLVDYNAVGNLLAANDEGVAYRTRQASRKTGKGSSVLVTAAVVIGDTLGAGLLTMSSAVSMYGWLLGGIFIVAVFALNLHLCMLLWRMQMEFPHVHTLGELAEASFSRAPRWQQLLMRKITDRVQYVFVFFMLAADSTSFGKAFGLMFYDVHICLPSWVLIGSAILLPIHARTPSLGGNKAVIFLNCAVVICCVGCIMRHFLSMGVENTRPQGSEVVPMEPLTIMGVLNGLNIMMFNFTVQFMTVEIVAEMERPERFPLALWGLAYPFLAALFLMCGVGGYYFLGDRGYGLMLTHLPFGITLRVAAACLVYVVLTAYLLKSVVLCKTIQRCCDPDHSDLGSTRSETGYTLTIFAVLSAAFICSQVVPFFTPFIDLIGSTFAPLCCILIPVMMYAQWYRTSSNRRRFGTADSAEWMLVLFELAVCILVMTLGTYDSVLTIVGGWAEFGAPFSCHCEHLWNTCQCSPHKSLECHREYPWQSGPEDRMGTLHFSEAPTLMSLRHHAGLWWY
jgi:amino acid permease